MKSAHANVRPYPSFGDALLPEMGSFLSEMFADLAHGQNIAAGNVGLGLAHELLQFSGGEFAGVIVLHEAGDGGGKDLIDGFIAAGLDLILHELF